MKRLRQYHGCWASMDADAFHKMIANDMHAVAKNATSTPMWAVRIPIL